jgi:hypothetical protein
MMDWRIARIALASAICLMLSGRTVADFVLYPLPEFEQPIVLEGVSKSLPGGQFEFIHPLGSIVLRSDRATLIKAPSRSDAFRRLKFLAAQSKMASEFLNAAREALRLGLWQDCLECCDQAAKLDPTDPTVRTVEEVRRRMRTPLPVPHDSETQLRERTGLQTFHFAHSEHYAMLYSTDETRHGKKKDTRSESRLRLLESVYTSYYLFFALHGFLLEPPSEPLLVLLFAEEQDFQRYSATINPRLVFSGGYWSTRDNMSVFYDQATTPAMKRFTEVSEKLMKQKSFARGTSTSAEVSQHANAVELISRILKDEADIEIVSHEAIHQLAGNSGLMPRDRIASQWAHEGLAAYFETSSSIGRAGVGAVNSSRLLDHRTVSRDPKRRGIAAIVSDRIFLEARNQLEAVEAYGPAWALTHFMMQTRPQDMMAYYRKVHALSNTLSDQQRIQIFIDTFGPIDDLDQAFQTYTASLKTEIERIRSIPSK